MEKEASLYHQLVEHPFIVLLVGSLLVMTLMSLFAMWLHRRSRYKEAESSRKNDSESDMKLGE